MELMGEREKGAEGDKERLSSLNSVNLNAGWCCTTPTLDLVRVREETVFLLFERGESGRESGESGVGKSREGRSEKIEGRVRGVRLGILSKASVNFCMNRSSPAPSSGLPSPFCFLCACGSREGNGYRAAPSVGAGAGEHEGEHEGEDEGHRSITTFSTNLANSFPVPFHFPEPERRLHSNSALSQPWLFFFSPLVSFTPSEGSPEEAADVREAEGVEVATIPPKSNVR